LIKTFASKAKFSVLQKLDINHILTFQLNVTYIL